MSVAEISSTLQYLTFMLGEEMFALDIAKVREVLEFTSVTRVPKTPEFMRGVINLRGAVVPVVDMRLKFGMSMSEQTINTCIVIVETELDGEVTALGALVDSVQEVFELEPENIEPPPKIGTRLKTEFITGMWKKDDEFIIILDIDKVFSSEELSVVQDVAVTSPGVEGEECLEGDEG